MNFIGKKGVDISSQNGVADISKIKQAGYDFVMIRCGYGSDYSEQDDWQFENNVAQCEKLGIPWGTYLISYALNLNQGASELNHILRLLKNKKPLFPVAYDVEYLDYRKNNGGWTFENVNACTSLVLSGLAENGYYPMLYTGFDEIENYISPAVWEKYDMWFAQWWKQCDYTGSNLGMWQYGGETNYIESNSIDGVGVIDKDKCYKNYPEIIKNGGYNNWKPAKPVLDHNGFEYGDNTLGVMAAKELLRIAKRQKIITQGVDENSIFGTGTKLAVNEFLRKNGYFENGIAGVNFLRLITKQIK